MGKRVRKEDHWRDNSSSSSSDAKRRSSRHYQNGETNDKMPPWDVFRDTVMELRDAIQVMLSTEEKLQRKIQKLKEKRKKDKKKYEEDKKKQEEDKKKYEEDKKKQEEDLRIVKEEIRILKEHQQDLESKIQEMGKEGCAEVDHYKASPSQRSQLSQSTRFRLVIENSVSRTIYKKETVETEDGGGHVKVVMYDGGKPIASDHHLASVKVELVLIEGWFNEPKQDSWSKGDFEKSIIKPRRGITRLVKNGTFDLIDGSCDHEGAIIMDNSQKREVKLGVRIAVYAEERVLEGVSNPFKVQESKTKSSKKKGKKPPPPPTVTPMVQGYSEAFSWPPFSIESQFQEAAFGAVNQPLLPGGQDQCTSFSNGGSELDSTIGDMVNPSVYMSLNDIQVIPLASHRILMWSCLQQPEQWETMLSGCNRPETVARALFSRFGWQCGRRIAC